MASIFQGSPFAWAPGRRQPRHARPGLVALLALLAAVAAAGPACRSDDSHPNTPQDAAGDGGADADTDASLSADAAIDAPSVCPASITQGSRCSVPGDITCPVYMVGCLPARCQGTFENRCQCQNGVWSCATYECFVCSSDLGSDGGADAS